jgi:hypothetical protein
MNFIEGLPKLEGKDIILVVVDRFIKYWHLVVLSHLFTAQDVVKMFMDHLFRFHRLPTTIMTNQDKCLLVFFFWKELFNKSKVKLLMSSTCNPLTNRQTKRLNQCLETYLRCVIIH